MVFHRKVLVLLLVALTGWAFAQAPFHPKHAQHGMVVSVHPLASKAGVEVMRAGGNAVDAAVATGFALAVAHPQAGNLGGGGFMLIRLASGETHFIDYRETAPAAATRDMYLDPSGNVIPGASLYGYRAIGIPGTVAGLVYAQRHWGKLTLAQDMAAAIALARNGFRVTWEDADDFRTDTHLPDYPESRRIFLRNGTYYAQGDLFRQPELARTLARIAATPDTFYRGAMAKEIAAAVHKGGGLITAKDLADYKVKDRKPIKGTYRGYEIISAPPPSSGGIALIESLNILEAYDLARLGNRSAESMHLTVEAFRRAMFDRSELLGDPDFVQDPVAQLIDKKYAAAWRETITPQATPSTSLKRPQFEGLDQVAYASRLESPDTTHYSVVDAAGNAVAVTTTLNDSFGSRVTVPGLSFLLNNEMDDFTSKPGAENTYHLIQSENNAIAPGKRPLSSMTPTIVTKDGKLFMVTGSPGGGTIPTNVANVIMAVLDYGLDVQQAVDAPRFHHQWLPDQIYIEAPGFSPDTLKLLQAKGHKIRIGYYEGADKHWGGAETIVIDPDTNERLGGNDGRYAGAALGY
jgi:gamma-glutamyltranspeptidase/glutathione hydrolase